MSTVAAFVVLVVATVDIFVVVVVATAAATLITIFVFIETAMNKVIPVAEVTIVAEVTVFAVVVVVVVAVVAGVLSQIAAISFSYTLVTKNSMRQKSLK